MPLPHITVLLTTVLSITTSTVYNVTPDDSECDHCLDLQYYQLNAVKYFASNYQLKLLSGLHRLHTNLIIQNAHNISLIGNMANGTTPDTVIQCTSSIGIVMTNITNLTVRNMIVKNCRIKYRSLQAAVFIKDCSFVKLHSVHIYHARHVISLLGVNILEDSYMNYITCLEMHFYYNETITKTKRHNISVNHYHSTTNRFRGNYGIYLHMSQYTYEITFHVLNTFIEKLKQSIFLYTISNSSAIQNTVLVTNC